ncbi:MAG: aconitase X catalytic domain-containing protein [Mycobacteriales bacterium]
MSEATSATPLTLSDDEQAMLDGAQGEALALAMRIVTGLARANGAPYLIPIASAHIDSCLYHGVAGLDFAERLASLGGRVKVPTTLNVSSLDLLHPGLVKGDDETMVNGRRLMDAYVSLGASPTWTCAPYQLAEARPPFGTNVAWAESNAIVFCNSVLGARTDRYGDFLDICAAITGRAPYAGLHVTENRAGQIVFDLTGLPQALRDNELFPAVVGQLIGRRTGTAIPVIVGLPATTGEDALKALGAAAASSGGVALFHVVGITPEAATLEIALQGNPPLEVVTVTRDMIAAARAELSTVDGAALDAISVGTPHFSLAECGQLAELLADGPAIDAAVAFYASTSRRILEAARPLGFVDVCERAGVQFVVDTCTYITPILAPDTRVVMTNSGKWAYYAPGNLGVDVIFATLAECVASARAGHPVLEREPWGT